MPGRNRSRRCRGPGEQKPRGYRRRGAAACRTAAPVSRSRRAGGQPADPGGADGHRSERRGGGAHFGRKHRDCRGKQPADHDCSFSGWAGAGPRPRARRGAPPHRDAQWRHPRRDTADHHRRNWQWAGNDQSRDECARKSSHGLDSGLREGRQRWPATWPGAGHFLIQTREDLALTVATVFYDVLRGTTHPGRRTAAYRRRLTCVSPKRWWVKA